MFSFLAALLRGRRDTYVALNKAGKEEVVKGWDFPATFIHQVTDKRNSRKLGGLKSQGC